MWEHHQIRVETDANYIGKLERGRIGWPSAQYRQALRHPLAAPSDAALGLINRRRTVVRLPAADRAPLLRGGVTGVGGGSCGQPQPGTDSERRVVLEPRACGSGVGHLPETDGVEPRVRYVAGLLDTNHVGTRRVVGLGSFRALHDQEQVAPQRYAPEARSEIDLLTSVLTSAFPGRAGWSDATTGDHVNDPHRAEQVRRRPGQPDLTAYAARSSDPGTRPANTADTYQQFARDADLRTGQAILIVASAIYLPFPHLDAVQAFAGYAVTVESVGVPTRSAAPTHPPSAYLQEIRSTVRSTQRLLRAGRIGIPGPPSRRDLGAGSVGPVAPRAQYRDRPPPTPDIGAAVGGFGDACWPGRVGLTRTGGGARMVGMRSAECPGPVKQPNQELRRARERTPSPSCPGECLSRQELAELVNAHVWEHHRIRVETDANYIGKLERGLIGWPGTQYRQALRHLLAAPSDATLGLINRRRTVVRLPGGRSRTVLARRGCRRQRGIAPPPTHGAGRRRVDRGIGD
jgi:hypothetical protein